MSERISKPDAEKLETVKRDAFERLCVGRPDAVIILARDIVKNEATSRMQSGSYGNVDIHGMMGGAKARTIAGAEMHKVFPDATIVANSWIKTEPVSYARVTADELEKRGVDKNSIILQEQSYSTFTELIELIKLIVAHDWKHVSIVVNEFSIPRAKAMLEHIHELHDPNGYSRQPDVQQSLRAFKEMTDTKIVFVSAEEVLLATSTHYKKTITEARQLPQWQVTMEREEAAAQQVRDGKYWQNLPSTFVKQ